MRELLSPELIDKETHAGNAWSDHLIRLTAPVRIYAGIDRLLVALGFHVPGIPDAWPRPLREELFYLERQPKALAAESAEGDAALETIAAVKASGTLGDLPLTVVTAGRAYDSDIALTDEEKAQEVRAWNVMQAEQVHLSSRGTQVIVADSGHMIPYERPEAVVSAIRDVWADARSARPH